VTKWFIRLSRLRIERIKVRRAKCQLGEDDKERLVVVGLLDSGEAR